MAQANPLTFFSEVRAELKKVIWPTRAETVKLTAVVIGVSLAVGIYIGTLDIVLTKVNALIFR